MISLDAILAGLTPAGEGLSTHIPAEWMQGRTTYGGLSTALAHEAVRRTAPALPTLRSALVAFVGPVGEAVTLSHRVLRQGKSTAFVEADATSAEGLGLRAAFAFAGSRETMLTFAAPAAPSAQPPEDCEPMFPPGAGPGFIGNFEVRQAGTGRPLSGGEPDLLVWARLREPSRGDPVTALLALADVLPPAILVRAASFMRISSMTWNVDLLAPQAPTRDDWRLVRAVARTAGEGYSVQEMGMWTTEGVAVLTGSQNVAVFG